MEWGALLVASSAGSAGILWVRAGRLPCRQPALCWVAYYSSGSCRVSVWPAITYKAGYEVSELDCTGVSVCDSICQCGNPGEYRRAVQWQGRGYAPQCKTE